MNLISQFYIVNDLPLKYFREQRGDRSKGSNEVYHVSNKRTLFQQKIVKNFEGGVAMKLVPTVRSLRSEYSLQLWDHHILEWITDYCKAEMPLICKHQELLFA